MWTPCHCAWLSSWLDKCALPSPVCLRSRHGAPDTSHEVRRIVEDFRDGFRLPPPPCIRVRLINPSTMIGFIFRCLQRSGDTKVSPWRVSFCAITLDVRCTWSWRARPLLFSLQPSWVVGWTALTRIWLLRIDAWELSLAYLARPGSPLDDWVSAMSWQDLQTLSPTSLQVHCLLSGSSMFFGKGRSMPALCAGRVMVATPWLVASCRYRHFLSKVSFVIHARFIPRHCGGRCHARFVEPGWLCAHELCNQTHDVSECALKHLFEVGLSLWKPQCPSFQPSCRGVTGPREYYNGISRHVLVWCCLSTAPRSAMLLGLTFGSLNQLSTTLGTVTK